MRKTVLSKTPSRVAVVVLGMHRSGTSALTRVLSLLGCDLPNNIVEAVPGENDLGFWESRPLCDFNNKLLASAGSVWDDWLAVNPGWFSSPKREEFHEEALALLSQEFGASYLFAFKDPRLCRILPFWLDILEAAEIAPRIVLPIRNPLEVAASLEKRNGYDLAHGLLIWLRHTLDAEHFSRGRTRVFTSFDQLMKGWARQAARISERLEIQWPRLSDRANEEIAEFLSESFRHHRETSENVTENPLLSGWLREAYGIFLRWSETGEREADFAALDRIRAELDFAGPAFGRLLTAGRRATIKSRELERNLAATRSALAESQHDAERSALSAKDALAQSESLRDEVQKGHQEMSALRSRLSETESALSQRRAEVDDTAAELVAARAELQKARSDVENMRAKLEKTETSLADATKSLSDAQHEIGAARQALKEERQAKAVLEGRMRTQAQETASISKLLGEKEAQTEWLSQTAAIMFDGSNSVVGRLSAWLPEAVRRNWRLKKLQKAGLFDPNAYLATHDDVAQNGVDPFSHYIKHGLIEGRSRGGKE